MDAWRLQLSEVVAKAMTEAYDSKLLNKRRSLIPERIQIRENVISVR